MKKNTILSFVTDHLLFIRIWLFFTPIISSVMEANNNREATRMTGTAERSPTSEPQTFHGSARVPRAPGNVAEAVENTRRERHPPARRSNKSGSRPRDPEDRAGPLVVPTESTPANGAAASAGSDHHVTRSRPTTAGSV